MIIFLYGTDTFRSRQKLSELKERFLREVDPTGDGLSEIDGSTAAFADLKNALTASSLFVKKRMIVVNNPLANKNKKVGEELELFLRSRDNDEDENVIIIRDEVSGEKLSRNKLFAFLAKQKYVQNFTPLSNTAVAAWVRSEVERRGGKIRPQAALMLSGYFQSDLWQLNNEVEKLVNYKKGQHGLLSQAAEIETADIEAMCRGNSDENIFALTDAIGAKNRTLMLRNLEKEFDLGANDSYILHMIVRQIKNLIQVKDAMEQDMSIRKMESTLGLHPYVVKKTISQAGGFTLRGLIDIFNKLVLVDEAIKTGKGNIKSELSYLLVKI